MKKIIGMGSALALGVLVTVAQADIVPRSAAVTGLASVTGPKAVGPVAQGPAPYSTGFNSGQGFTTGWMGTQQGWFSFPSVQAEAASLRRPEIAGTTVGGDGSVPFEGDQQLRLRNRAASSLGAAVGTAYPFASPYTNGESVIISLQTKITAADGAEYYVEPADAVNGIITARVRFDYLSGRQAIYVFDDNGAGGFQYTDTGTSWTANVWKELRIEQTLGGNIKYYYGGVLIYDDLNGIPGAATTMDELAIYSDNYQLAESGYFDALSITPEPASLALLALGALSAVRRRK